MECAWGEMGDEEKNINQEKFKIMPENNDSRSFRETLKRLFAENKHKQAIDMLMEFVGTESDSSNQLIMQLARIDNLKKLVNTGILEHTEFGKQMNPIIDALLNITDSIVPAPNKVKETDAPIKNNFSGQIGFSFQRLNVFWGMSLAFSFIGLVLIVVANFNKSSYLQLGAFWIGAALIVLSFSFFLFLQLKGTLKIANSFRENEDIINELQKISLDLTRITKKATRYSVTNSQNIKELLSAVTPSLKRLGLITDQNEDRFNNSGKLLEAIMNYSEEVEETIKELETALIEGDSKKLREFASKTKELSSRVSTFAGRLDGT
jgi:hypothetical protein